MFVSVFILKYPIDLSLQKDFSYYLSLKVQKRKKLCFASSSNLNDKGGKSGQKKLFANLVSHTAKVLCFC